MIKDKFSIVPLTFLVVGIMLIASCSTDVDVIGDWQETSVVYGLLNQSDTAHYIKVSKAFLGDENAMVMAQEYDSLYYGSELTVSLERVKNGNVLETITLQRDTSIPKESGTFSSPNQVLYKTTKTLHDDSKYNLKISNSKTGNEVSASTTLVKDFTIDKPKSTESINWNLVNSDYKVKWQSPVNGKLSQVTIRFYYTEQDKTTTLTEDKYIDWVFTAQESDNTEGGEDMEVAIAGQSFYTFLSSMIEVNSNVNRFIGKLDFTITVAGEDFTTYMDVNQPSTGILQEKPIYTNIDNGIGIFSSRFEKSVKGLSMVTSSQDSIRYGQHTKNLGFQ